MKCSDCVYSELECVVMSAMKFKALQLDKENVEIGCELGDQYLYTVSGDMKED